MALEDRDPNYLKDTIVKSMQTFAWHNIKLIVRTFELSNFHENHESTLEEISSDFRRFLKESSITIGYHILFIYRIPLAQEVIVGHALFILGNNPVFSSAVVQIHNKDTLEKNTTHVAFSHELGHLFGGMHISDLISSKCIEEDYGCIMVSTVFVWPDEFPYPPAFSGKGFRYLEKYFEIYHKNDFLMNNVNHPTFHVCGNGMVDPGEECDCGFDANCKLDMEDNYCNMKTCKFKQKCECIFGECCNKCKIKKKGVICRKPDQCRETEQCTGLSPFCPKSNNKPDGTSCRLGEAFCVNGECPIIQNQCYVLHNSKRAAYKPMCVDRIDQQKEFDLTINEKKSRKSYCGLLPCYFVFPKNEENTELYQQESDGACVYVIPTLSDNFLGFIPNGHKCGNKKMCINNRCINATLNKITCEDIFCPDGTVCFLGKCESEYKDFTPCKNKNCPSNQYCNKEGLCANYIIPEHTFPDNQPSFVPSVYSSM